MKNKQPIYLGKLYAEIPNIGVKFIDVYHFLPDFHELKYHSDTKLKEKLNRFNENWVSVKIGIKELDFYVEEANPAVVSAKKYLRRYL